MVELYGRTLTRREVAEHTGMLSQVAGVRLATLGDGIERGNRVLDDSFLVMFNAHGEPLRFTLPDERYGSEWIPVVDTAAQDLESNPLDPSWEILVQPRSIVVLRCPRVSVAASVPGLTEEATA